MSYLSVCFPKAKMNELSACCLEKAGFYWENSSLLPVHPEDTAQAIKGLIAQAMFAGED